MSQLVQHKSREVTYTVNFTDADTVNSQSVRVNGSGNVYEITSQTNIATWNIGGGTSIPVSLTAETFVSVTITKTTPGSAASISFKVRKETPETVTSNALDYSQYTGRYLYCINSSSGVGTVYKYDCNLLLPSNYAGAGSWTVNPLVATITLPTITGGDWFSMAFIKEGGINRIVCIGRVTNNTVHGCVIKTDNTVWNMGMTVQNAMTTLSTLATNGITTLIKHPIYDHSDEYLFYSGSTYPQPVYRIALPETVTSLGTMIPADYWQTQVTTAYRIPHFNDNQQYFHGDGWSFKIKSVSDYQAGMYNIIPGGRGYSKKRNRIYVFENSTAAIRVIQSNPDNEQVILYSPNANNDGTTSGANTVGQSCRVVSLSALDQTGIISTAFINNGFGIFNMADQTYKVGRFQNLFAGQTFCNRLAGSPYAGVWIFGGTGGTNNNRLYICKKDQTPMNFGYIDTPSVVDTIVTDTLIL